MTRAALLGIAAVSLGLACTEKGRSVVLVEVSAGSVVGVDSVFVHITQPGQPSHHAEGTGAPPWKLGVYLPKSVSGLVNVEVCAFKSASTGTHEVIQAANAETMVPVAPGETAGPVVVVLETGAPFAVCGGMVGAGGRGGAGGSGSGGGGVSGSAGAGGAAGGIGGAGGVGGAGGSAAGTGGVAGSIGGASGLAGRGGVGGGLAGGPGGGGRGGVAGGLAGGGGRGGTTGTAGMGGAGRGGTTGAAGMGGTPSDWRGAGEVRASPTAIERTPSVAVAFNGRAVVVFDVDGQIYASCYDPSATPLAWSTPRSISGAGSFQLPVVAVDGAGQFTAVWAHGMGATTTGIWLTTSPDCLSWNAPPGMLTTTNAAKPAIALNSNNVGIIAWQEQVNGAVQATASVRLTPTSTWSLPPTPLKVGDDISDRLPAVGVTGLGETFVVWQQIANQGDAGSITWAGTDRAGGWRSATLLEGETTRAYAPAIATNGTNAIVTYLVRRANTTQLWERRWDATQNNFLGAVMVAEAQEIDSTVPPSVTLDNLGVATVAWGALTSGRYQMNASQAASSSWSPVLVETDNAAADDGTFGTTSFATMPVVRGDGNGTVFVVWRKRIANTRFDLFAQRFKAGAWGGEMKIEAIDISGTGNASVYNPVLGVNGSGQAVAAWYYGGPNVSVDVYANVSR